MELVVHADEECPLRTLICPFCTLAVVALEHSNHVSYCGARTEVCVECKAYIKYVCSFWCFAGPGFG